MTNLQKRKLQDKIFHILVLSATLFGLVVLVILLKEILNDGLKWINIDFFRNFASRFPRKSGIKAPLFGSLWIIGLTALFAFPIGVGSALYLEEYLPKNWLTNLIQVNISNLAGVPSIVFGILGLGIFVNTLGFGRSILSGALTLALLILPVIIVSAQEAIKSVPKELKQGAYALGCTKWQMITGVLLPYAMPGILTGTILAIARALGETAPLLMVGAVTFIAYTPEGIFDSFTTLPMQIYNWTSRPKVDFHHIAAAAIIVLLILLLGINSLAIYLRNRYQSRMSR
ncbi:phosphate ABC transporter membrane protein 2, PhoT family (TC 3.A.1.7.1) [Caloranaerobacter azorensis DSM 13643]|uniref:Phosphate transport system permease protein PstA n=1 Tax=Caloranaerobacter azorensis DSM 13643 TaxID=1121264 RepID=A0A1M5V6D9_9FIRM|nr:phosphate ABC transporter permease PstA [Caloranaerobacter azorensis]SHH70644.1 phosphate ABC transporter membrane protein 2, PhoT family (TC 3.A.1.7.1) [Caloranaerobacter azorensis DSM 13643]